MTTREKVAAAYELHGDNVSALSREVGVERSTIRHHLKALGLYGKPLAGGRLPDTDIVALDLPPEGEVMRVLLTSAQNNTHVHAGFWNNLLALAGHYGADILVSTFNYNKNAYGGRAVKRGKTATEEDKKPLWYDPEIRDYICDDKVEVAPGLIFCGDLCLSPTASRPLTGWRNHTRRKSGIFPHPKVALESVAATGGRAAKMNYTTGAVTLHNYIAKAAGQKAEFHHTFGALLVEVDSDGHWFVRQVIGNKKGALQDLDVAVSGGKVTTGNRVECITWGDFHSAHIDPTVRKLGWGGTEEERLPLGYPTMLDALRPKEQHVHDLLDFYSRNHHDRKNPRLMFQRWAEGRDDVVAELKQAAQILREVERPWAKTVVVNSNHDRAMQRWLDEIDGRHDPRNARFWFQANDAAYGAVEDCIEDDFVLLEWAMRRYDCPKGVRFLREDESHVICGDIECGIHGDRGASGTRGTIAGLAQIGDRLNGADKHQAAILWGSYWAGTSSKTRLGYTKGPSAWSHSHIVTYPNGKRTIITMFSGKWRA